MRLDYRVWILSPLRQVGEVTATYYRRPWGRWCLVASAVLVGCAGDRQPAPPSASVVPAVVTPAQFVRLRWLSGQWRGTDAGGAPFYEGYRFLDDSTIQMYAYADSSGGQVNDSSRITLRTGMVVSGSEKMSWVVTAIDSIRVTFGSRRGATNGFSWTSVSADAWTARLTWDSAGTTQEKIYEMRRLAP